MSDYALNKNKLNDQITNVNYYQFSETGTLCTLTLNNGYVVTGVSSCIDPTIFNEDIGKKIAYDNAFDTLWALLGYQEKQRWFEETQLSWSERVQLERDKLLEKLSKLRKLIYNLDGTKTTYLDSITEEHWELLYKQYSIMEQYVQILNERLSLAE